MYWEAGALRRNSDKGSQKLLSFVLIICAGKMNLLLKRRSDYCYHICKEEQVVYITDLDTCQTSVTNNAENVLSEIRSVEGGVIEKMEFVYMDSEKRWDTIVPKWMKGKCITVEFKNQIFININ